MKNYVWKKSTGRWFLALKRAIIMPRAPYEIRLNVTRYVRGKGYYTSFGSRIDCFVFAGIQRTPSGRYVGYTLYEGDRLPRLGVALKNIPPNDTLRDAKKVVETMLAMDGFDLS